LNLQVSKSSTRGHKTLEEEAAKNNEKAIRPFVLYNLRHTFLTRLGESGCDAWTLARIAGHSNVSMSSRYVHPSEDAVLTAMARLGGHKIGHSDNQVNLSAVEYKRETGGRDRDRTGDPLLAKQVLSQLSYTPTDLAR
jgi:hypothetical protein